MMIESLKYCVVVLVSFARWRFLNKKGDDLKTPHAFKCQVLFLLLSPAVYC